MLFRSPVGGGSVAVPAGGPSRASGGSTGGLVQAASNPRIAAGSQGTARVRAQAGAPVSAVVTARVHSRTLRHGSNFIMWVILLEALGAGLIFVLIVWWTMFAGRKGGERRGEDEPR